MTLHRSKKRWVRVAVAVAVVAIAGAVFAATTTSLFSVSVDTEGKTDQEIEGEIHDQLVDQGIDQPEVEFKRNDDHMKVDIAGQKDGREFRVVQKRTGDEGSNVVEIAPPELDTTREPGMSDTELEAKIRAQMEQRGLEGAVKVKGDEIMIKARKHVDECDDGPCAHHDDE